MGQRSTKGGGLNTNREQLGGCGRAGLDKKIGTDLDGLGDGEARWVIVDGPSTSGDSW